MPPERFFRGVRAYQAFPGWPPDAACITNFYGDTLTLRTALLGGGEVELCIDHDVACPFRHSLSQGSSCVQGACLPYRYRKPLLPPQVSVLRWLFASRIFRRNGAGDHEPAGKILVVIPACRLAVEPCAKQCML